VAQQEVRQHGYVYQKNRKQSEAWIPTEQPYGRYRVDVPGESGQREVRVALGFCRDRISAMPKLQNAMKDAGVLDAAKLRERIMGTATFAQQAEWMIAEMKAGRIVNAKTRERIGDRTIDFYSTAVAYLSDVLGAKPVAAIDNAQARELVSRMRNELTNDGSNRFSIKTLTEYFKTFTKVVRSAVDNNEVHPRTWNLAFIGLPTVDKKKQHRPTLAVEEITQLVTNTAGRYQMGVALLAGSNMRISELLALCIEKHISDDRQTLYIRQQRKKDGSGVTDVLKTPAACRDIDLHSSLAKISTTSLARGKADSSSRRRTAPCCPRRTSSGMAWSRYSRKWGEPACAFMHSAASVKRRCKRAKLDSSSSTIGWDMRTTR
jgi:integrase